MFVLKFNYDSLDKPLLFETYDKNIRRTLMVSTNVTIYLVKNLHSVALLTLKVIILLLAPRWVYPNPRYTVGIGIWSSITWLCWFAPIFATYPAASKNSTHFESDQKVTQNIQLTYFSLNQ